MADTRERQYQIKKRPLYFFSTFDIKNYEEGCEENKMIIDSTRYGLYFIILKLFFFSYKTL